MEGKFESGTENPRSFGGTPDPVSEEEKLKASPEEQKDYEMLVIRARKMIFGEAKEQILEMLGSSESPAKGIGQAASMIVKSLLSSAKEQGKEISPDSALNAGGNIAAELNALAKVNGVFEYDSKEEEEKELQDGILWGVKLYGDGMIKSGELTPEIQSAAKKQVIAAIQEDAKTNPKKKPIPAAVEQAVNQPQQGIIGSQMQRGM